MGAGTTGMVARRLGRDFVGCEIKPQYVAAAMRRIADRTSLPLFETAVEVKS
jgi:DNA modification methylase